MHKPEKGRVEHEGQIKGAFKGWTGRGVYELTDGSLWQQVHYSYHYHYAYRPHARVVNVGGTLYLEVDGMSERIEVRRTYSRPDEEEEEDEE